MSSPGLGDGLVGLFRRSSFRGGRGDARRRMMVGRPQFGGLGSGFVVMQFGGVAAPPAPSFVNLIGPVHPRQGVCHE